MKYDIVGTPLPAVICTLNPGEKMITERGSMSWMTPNMQMETSAGGIGKAFSKMFSGEAMFQNIYTCVGGEGMIAFSAKFPGQIKAFEIGPGKEYIFQKKSFLAGEVGVNITTHFQKRAAAGFFGGEGFILQKISWSENCGGFRPPCSNGSNLQYGYSDSAWPQKCTSWRRRYLQHSNHRPWSCMAADNANLQPCTGNHPLHSTEQ